MGNMNLPEEILACPQCRAPLRGMRCGSCDRQYLTAGGLPVLMTPADCARFQVQLDAGAGREMAARYQERAPAGPGFPARLKQALRPPLPLVHNPREPALAIQPGSRNLYLGGGGRQVSGFINVDLGPFPGVDALANAEHLPFLDSTLDAVECDAVLEHVEQPEQAVAEIRRVLKPGGQVHAVVPFCHPFHAYPADFRRWTLAGLRSLFSEFECLDSGVRTGPTATLLAFALDYIKLWMPGRTAARAAYAAAGWLLFPLRYLDLLLLSRRDAHVLANHIYILARKRNCR